jgi:hypothetical protein
MSCEDVRLFMAYRIPPFWSIAFVPCPSSPAEAVPVLASFAGVIATMAKIVISVVTFRAMVV